MTRSVRFDALLNVCVSVVIFVFVGFSFEARGGGYSSSEANRSTPGGRGTGEDATSRNDRETGKHQQTTGKRRSPQTHAKPACRIICRERIPRGIPGYCLLTYSPPTPPHWSTLYLARGSGNLSVKQFKILYPPSAGLPPKYYVGPGVLRSRLRQMVDLSGHCSDVVSLKILVQL